MSSAVPPTELTLSPDERRLVLLGQVDFEGDWEAMGAATTFVVDGPAKASLIRKRLARSAARSAPLFRHEIDVLELFAARHWFDTQACQKTARPRRAKAPGTRP